MLDSLEFDDDTLRALPAGSPVHMVPVDEPVVEEVAEDGLTPDVAAYIAGWLRGEAEKAPPPSQRNTLEWLLERLDRAALPQKPDQEPEGAAE